MTDKRSVKDWWPGEGSEYLEPISPEFLENYLEAALWASVDEEGEPLDKNHSTDHFSEEAIREATKETNEFIQANINDLEVLQADMSQHGHDFWLTRNGHGAGFWDRGYGEIGDRLSRSAESFGETYVYMGDDGQLYFG